MNTRSSEAWLRQRAQLLMRSGQLRAELSLHAQALDKPLALADRARHSLHWLLNHPQWPLAALIGVLLLRPRRVLGWAGTLWWGYGLARRARWLLLRRRWL